MFLKLIHGITIFALTHCLDIINTIIFAIIIDIIFITLTITKNFEQEEFTVLLR